MIKQDLQQAQVQVQRIDPKLILANHMLELPVIALNEAIENEITDNPALEVTEERPCNGDCLDKDACPYCSRRWHSPAGDKMEDATRWLNVGSDTGASASSPNSALDDFDPIANIEAVSTLQDHLALSLGSVVSGKDYRIGEYIIDSLDDNGWLTIPLDEIAADIKASVEDVSRVLQIIQSFDPPGVGAQSLQDCMLIQLRHLAEIGEGDPMAEKIVCDYFDPMTRNRYSKLARSLGVTVDSVKSSLQFIKERLNPYPANQYHPSWDHSPTHNSFSIKPDIIIQKTEFGYSVEIVESDNAVLCVNPSYREAYQKVQRGDIRSEQERKHIIEYVERAELFIRNLNQRRQTLRQIAQLVIDMQQGYLATGSRRFLLPLTRTTVAHRLKVHESTVSRATAEKYVQLPNQEVVPFGIFFNNSLSMKSLIEEIIRDEDPSDPLSDQKIVDILAERGIVLSRRTIAKYRGSQKILSSMRRKH